MSRAEKVLIVGGGIGGMTLGTALHHAGIAAEIVELSPDWAVIGYGISVQGATLRALKTIGVLDQCVRAGFGYSKLFVCKADGEVTGTVELPSLLGEGYPECLGMMRPALARILRDALAAERVPVRTGLTVETFHQKGDTVDVWFTDGSRGSYDLVVGADGVHSRMRQMLFGDGVQPVDMGQAVWRAMVPRAPEIRGRHSFYGPRHKCGLNPVSEDEMYVFLVEPTAARERVPDPELPARMRALLADFDGVIARAREHITRPERIVRRPLDCLLLPSPWYRGRVLLIGDAAHAPTPQLASGAGMAVEDAIVLAELLAQELSVEGVLERFMVRRYERCRMVVEASRQLSEWEKAPNSPGADPVGLLARTNAALAAPI